MYKLLTRFFSERLMIILLIIYAISMGVGTFIEKIYSTDTAKNIVYETKWFECIMLFLLICLIISIKKYKLWSINKLPLLLFHIALIIIFLGASISRYFGFEGMMLIRKGHIENTIISNKTYIKLKISQNNQIRHYHDNYLMSHLHYKYHGNYIFNNQIFNIQIINYIPYAQETFFETHDGKKMIKLVTINEGKRFEVFIQSGNIKRIGPMLITFNKSIKNAINIIELNGKLYIISPFNGSYFKMNTGVYKTFSKNIVDHLQLRSLYNINGYQFVFPDAIRTGKIKYISNNNNKNLPCAITAIISTKAQFKTVTFLGDRGSLNMNTSIFLDGKKIAIGYGSILLKLPFFIYLKNFILKKYPGSENPSYFSSRITLIDNLKKQNFNIYMNNILHYKGYKFFQSGYDSDGNGTKLSVNHDDLGSYISYIGYLLLTIGMFFTLFWKGTRFYDLHHKLITLISKSSFILFILFSIINIKANNLLVKDQGLTTIVNIDENHSKIFGKLLVQDFQGRIKPMNTMSLELLRKIYKQDNIYGLNSDQWMISMYYDGWLLSNHKISIGWIRIPFIKIGNEIINKLYNLYHRKYDGYISLMNLYNIDKSTNQIKFILEDECKNAFIKNPSQRNKYDNELININERINIILGIFQGKYLRIFPEKKNIHGTWQNGFFAQKDDIQSFNLINNYFYSLYFSQKNNKWNISNHFLKKIQIYQNLYGRDIIPTKNKIKYEILYNKFNIFYKCMISYFILSIIFLFIAFFKIFKPNNHIISNLFIINICIALIISLFHTIGLILRWYISGHAPWSNGYESAIFIAWCSIVVGYIFMYSKNPFVFAITNIIAAIILGVAHGNLMDPEITNLVPVLKSYWLMIHVSVITSSYGFLSTGAFLGFIVLILYLIQGKGSLKKKKIDHTIEELTIINEMTITIGLFLLTIGTFLGAVWANESWGRYWSWDPKETWALISIIIYTFVLHIRLIPELKNFFIFNLLTVLSISSIIMTYFGVNYYLSGLHSYGKGDPFPIPTWIYISLLIILFITIFSYYRNKEIIFNKKINSN